MELEFENPTWKSNWDFEEITGKFTVRFNVRFTASVIIILLPKNLNQKASKTTKQKQTKSKTKIQLYFNIHQNTLPLFMTRCHFNCYNLI